MLKWKSYLAIFVFTYKKPKKTWKSYGRLKKNGSTSLLFSESILFEI